MCVKEQSIPINAAKKPCCTSWKITFIKTRDKKNPNKSGKNIMRELKRGKIYLWEELL